MTLCINPNCYRPDRPENDKNQFCPSCGSQLELQGRYRVIRPLSYKTGFSTIYEAYAWTKPKILKVLKEDLSIYDKAVELFEEEAVILQQIRHPGVPTMEGYFHFHTRDRVVLHCIITEKVKGLNLEQWIQRHSHQPIAQEQALAWLKQLVGILHLLHNKRYLHRNIKPSNIMMRPNGQLVLTDFGTARQLTRSYLNKLGIKHEMPAMDSFGYTAPEQLSGEARIQSDFFALGRTFVFLLTGKHPVDMYAAESNVLNWRNSTRDISPLLLDLIDWLMLRELGKRPLNTQDILQRLKDIKKQITAPALIGQSRTVFSWEVGSSNELDGMETVEQTMETVEQGLETTIQPQQSQETPVYVEKKVEIPQTQEIVVDSEHEEMTLETFSRMRSHRTSTLPPPSLEDLPPLEPLPSPPKPQPHQLPKIAMFALLFVLLGLMGLASIAFLRSPDANIIPSHLQAKPKK